MQVVVLVIFLLSSLIILVPGVCLWSLLFPNESAFEQWISGSVCGLAAAVYIAFAVAHWRLSAFWAIWGALSLVVVPAVRAHLRGRGSVHSGVSRWALFVLGLVAVARFAITVIYQWPAGWDPSFHLILAKKVAMADGMIYDWTPFENASLNYPLGSHCLLVLLSQLSHLPLHRVFQMLLPLVCVLTTGQVYLLCLRVFHSEEIAVFSTLAYGFWAGYGSIDYYRWGGLPNALAMAFLLAIVHMLLGPVRTWKHVVLMGMFFASICFAHHHVMITSIIVLGVLFFYFLFSARRSVAVTLLIAMASGVLLASFYLVPYFLKSSTLGNTDVFRFHEGPFTARSLFRDLGPAYVLFGAAGLVLVWRVRKQFEWVPTLFVICGTLLILYILSGPVYRQVSLRFTGEDYVAFTPSRFLIDLACFVSGFAGYAAYQLKRRVGMSAVAATVLVVLLGLSTYRTWQQMIGEGGVPVGSLAAYQWISEYTPPDTIVLNVHSWACVTSWRRTLSSPLPISEPRHMDPAWQELRMQLQAGNFPPEALRHKLVKVVPPGQISTDQVLWKDPNGWSVVEVSPR